MGPRLSFIVPVNNTARWLDRCLTSILGAGQAELEVIAIDDGSTDNSMDVLSQWAARDRRLKVFHHLSRQGAGAARNTGLEQAAGTMIGFIDSDDCINLDVYLNLCRRMSEVGADIGACSVRLEDEHGNSVDRWSMPDGVIALDTVRGVKAAYRVLHDSCANKLFRRELLAGLRFPCILYEDGPFTIEAFCRARRMLFSSDEGYCYISRPRSNMQSAADVYKIVSAVESMALAWRSLRRRGIDGWLRKRYDIRMRWLLRLAVIGLPELDRRSRDGLWGELQALIPPIWSEILPFNAWERQLYLALLRRPSPVPLARTLNLTVDTAATFAQWVNHVRYSSVKES